FISKLTDSDAENSETQVWLEFALKCNYITSESFNELIAESEVIGKLINFRIKNPEKFGRSEEHTSELQSRENLVCRLLLEKKFILYNNIAIYVYNNLSLHDALPIFL